MAKTKKRKAAKTKGKAVKVVSVRDYIEIEMQIPHNVIAAIDRMAAVGILGATRDEVIEHIVREQLYRHHLQRVQK